MPVSALPFDSHPEGEAQQSRFRYFDRTALNFASRQTLGPYPIFVPGFRINVEAATWLTIYHRAFRPVGGAGTWRIRLRLFDLDDATALLDTTHDPVFNAAPVAPPAYFVQDIPLTPPLSMLAVGRVWRVVAVVFEVTGAAGQTIMDAKAFARFGRRGPE